MNCARCDRWSAGFDCKMYPIGDRGNKSLDPDVVAKYWDKHLCENCWDYFHVTFKHRQLVGLMLQ